MKKYRIVNQAMIDGKYINMVYLVEKRFLWFWVPIYDGSLSDEYMVRCITNIN